MKRETDGGEKAAAVNRRIRGKNRKDDNYEFAEWSGCDALLLQEVITAITKRGCAIQLGLTKDGATFVIRIVGDGEPYNEYVRPTEDIDVHLQGLKEDFNSG